MQFNVLPRTPTHTLYGTNQGGVISPILFICIIDDLPSVLANVEASLFADDTAVYKSGRSPDDLNTTMQKNSATFIPTVEKQHVSTPLKTPITE
jgi:Reverse transcriptase (RNA-dependent DNA polymerase)